MAGENNGVQTTIVTGTAKDVEARVAAIKASGGILNSVRVTKPADATGKLEVEITHS